MDGEFVVFKRKMVGFQITRKKKKCGRILKRILTSKLIFSLILHNEKYARGFLISHPLAINKEDCNLGREL